VIGRPHVYLLGLCVGIAGAVGWRPPFAFALVAGVPLLVVAIVLRSAAARVAAVTVLVALGGLAWGSARLGVLDRSVLLPLVGTTERVTVVVTAPPRRTPFSVRVFARTELVDDRRVSEAVLLSLPPARAPPQGARLQLVADIEEPRPPADGFDERAWLRRRGVHVVLHGTSWRLVGRRGGLAGFADRLHERLTRTIAPGLSGERRAILRGIVLGEDEGLDAELRDAFRASGLYHLLAVSGQNVAFLALGVLGLAWLLGIPRAVGQVGVIAAIGGYVLAVGWQPSVVRAGVAGALASLAWLAARDRDRWWFLLAGALVLLAWNPYSVTDPGFQLSFAAVAAIFVVVPRLQLALEGYPLGRWLRTLLAVAIACGAATAPIVWLHFRAVPVYTVPANALAAPVVGPLLGLGLLAAALHPVAPAAATALAWVNGWLASYLAACARAVAALPGAQITSGRVLVAIVASGAALLVWPRLYAPRPARAALLATTAAAALLGWERPREPPPPAPDGLRLTFIDVGQGDATLVQVPEGALLVDEGPPEAHVDRRLAALGVERLDAMLLSHPSRDNIGGAVEVVRRVPVRTVLEPDLPFENPFGVPAVREARRRGIAVFVPRAGDELRLGRLRIRVLWPRDGDRHTADPNDHAVVLLLSYGAFDALLPADAESNITMPLAVPAELYKVGHHGSRDDRLDELLARLDPKVAVISVGARNDYGHPTPSTLAALRARQGLRLYRTDLDGSVVVESDGRAIEVRTER
jgi:competence protein ComEC